MEFIKELLISTDTSNHIIALETIRAIIREAKLNANEKSISDLFAIVQPYRYGKNANKTQQRSYHIVHAATKERNLFINSRKGILKAI